MYFAVFSAPDTQDSQNIILKLFLEEDGVGKNFDVPVTPTTTCHEVISCVKEPDGEGNHIVLIWRGQERPIRNEENLYNIIQEWEHYKSEVKFVLRCDDPEPPPLPPLPSYQSLEEFQNLQYRPETVSYQYLYQEGDVEHMYNNSGEITPVVSYPQEYQSRYDHDEAEPVNSDGLLQISDISLGIQDHNEERFNHQELNGEEHGQQRIDDDLGEKVNSDEEGRKGYQRNGLRDNPPLHDMLPGGVDLTLSELQDMASRQQQQIEHQQQVLVAKEQRLKYLKQQEHRQQQIKAENDRLKKLRDKVENQEMKLKKLRALRGEVEKHRNSNGSLNSELESVKALFTEKEKELVMAVAKVEEMTRQLEQIHQERANVKNGTQSSAALELEKLRRELMIRNKLNEQQNSKLNVHKEMLIQRKDEIAKMDNRIYELQQRLKKKRAQQVDKNKNSNNKNVNEDKNINKPPNVAAVEPYIQYVPNEQKNVDDLKKGFTKQDPKYQTLPPNIKFPSPDNNNKTRSDDVAKEQNNNILPKDRSKPSGNVVNNVTNKNDQNGMSHKLSESVIKAAQRHQTSNTGAIVTSSGHLNRPPPPPIPARSSNTGLTYFTPRPFGSTYSTSVLTNRARASELPQTGPTINVQDEVRTGGSGQSSPASSDSSQKDGHVTKQGPVNNLSNKQDDNAPPIAGRQKLPNNADSKLPSHQKYSNSDHTDSSQLLKTSEFSSNKNMENKSEIPKEINTEGRNVSPTELKGKTSDNNGANGNNVSKPSTYKYASKNQIANTYMGRLGPEALQKYQKSLNMLYKNLVTDDSSQSQSISEHTEEKKEAHSSDNTTDNRVSTVNQSDPSSGGTFQTFTPPGSPQYPDMTSDKVSHNRNTPKTIRRRHSDSDNEDISKLIHKYVDRHNTHQNNTNVPHSNYSNDQVNMLLDTQATSFRGGIPENVPVDSMGNLVDVIENEENSDESNKNSNYVNVNPSNMKEGQTTVSKNSVVLRKKTNLRNRNSRSSGNRVSFDPLALLLDASLEGEVELVKTCAAQVVNVSESNDEGITALHNAICAGHYDIVTFLLEFGCDANSPDSDGWTPLHCAASCNNLPMVIFLVEHGACIFATTISDHETAAEKCEEDEDGFDGCSEYLYNVQEKLGIMNAGVVYAVFDYEAQNCDELSFKINDEISVLRKGDENEKEWWWSKIGDREGYVPRNLLGLYPRVLPKNHSKDS